MSHQYTHIFIYKLCTCTTTIYSMYYSIKLYYKILQKILKIKLKQGSTNFFLKHQIIYILGFACHMVFFATT